jgi:hypothetical protein
MKKLIRVVNVSAIGVLICAAAFGQTMVGPGFSRDYCVKSKDGKGAEHAAFLRDVSSKLAKVRVDTGEYASYTVAQAVLPAGRSARCDYHIVIGYAGFPPEAPGPEKTEADMKKAGLTMTREAMLAKRDDLSYLVSSDIWRWRERVGPSAKGNYARLNYYKVKPGATTDWVRMESTGWKQLAEAASKDHPGMGWRVATLAMPGGTALPYNAMTVDVFPSWEALGKGIPTRAIWNKVHPNTDMTAYMDRLGEIVERPRIDIVRFVEVHQK